VTFDLSQRDSVSVTGLQDAVHPRLRTMASSLPWSSSVLNVALGWNARDVVGIRLLGQSHSLPPTG